MERRNELKGRARELEYGDDPEQALALYQQLAERASGADPVLQSRIGELQLRLGRAEAVGSLNRAVRQFVDAGQLNNAIAVCRVLVDASGHDPDARLTLGKLSLERGYRRFAAESLASYARAATAEGAYDSALGGIASFLKRYPGERDLWRDWADELLGLGREELAFDLLNKLAGIVADAGHADSATKIQEEAARLGSTPLSAVSDDGDRDSGFAADDALPLLQDPAGRGPPSDGPGGFPDRRNEPADVAPLAGLEPTAGGGRSNGASEDADGLDEEVGDELPLLGARPDSAPPPRVPDDPGPSLPGLETSAVADSDTSIPELAQPMPDLEATTLQPDDGRDSEAGGDTTREDHIGLISPADYAAQGAFDEPPPVEAEPANADAPSPNEGRSEPEATREHPAEAADPDDRTEGFDPPATPEAATRTIPLRPFDLETAVAEIRKHTAASVEGDEEATTRYDVGVAFKEMGLHDEALAHLAAALENGNDPAATLEVTGEILIERGKAESAVRLLEMVSHAPSDGSNLAGVHYWLARGYEMAGREGDARARYGDVVTADSGFRDAARRLERLSATL